MSKLRDDVKKRIRDEFNIVYSKATDINTKAIIDSIHLQTLFTMEALAEVKAGVEEIPIAITVHAPR